MCLKASGCLSSCNLSIVSTQYSDLGGLYDAYRGYTIYRTVHLLPFSDLLSRSVGINSLLNLLRGVST